MAYTNARGVVEAAIREQGFGLGNGKTFDLYLVYECVDSPTHDPDDVYWILFFGSSGFDDMEFNPFVYEYIKVYARHKKTEYVVGDLMHALTIRARISHLLFQKFNATDVLQYIGEFEKCNNVFDWLDQFFNPHTGQIRRLELIDDVYRFLGIVGTTSPESPPSRSRVFETCPRPFHVGKDGGDDNGNDN